MSRRPNLKRLSRDLIDLYWTEARCSRAARSGGHRCFEILHAREGKLCPACAAFVKLQEAHRLILANDQDEVDGGASWQSIH